MPYKTDQLSSVAIKAAKATEKTRRLFDGAGLYLELRPDGARYWRLKYRYGRREKLLALGVYPEVPLAEARKRRNEARLMLREGHDPSASRKTRNEARKRDAKGAFQIVAADWLAFKRKGWATETHRKAEYVVNEYLIPALRGRPIAELGTRDVSKPLEKIAESAPNLAEKARQYMGGIVNYAIMNGLREDGRLLSLRGVVPKYEKGHIPAATTAAEIGPLLKAIDGYDSPITRTALKLAMLTAMRPGVVASAKWAEIDLEGGEWHVPAERMKSRHAHIVPLPTQAVKMLRELNPQSEKGVYVFPSPARQKTPHVHRDALSRALRQMGFQGKHATHGFRGMLRTVARERLSVDIDVLEAQLAHAKKGDVQKAYDRTTFDDKRRKVMQGWADYLDGLKRGDKVVPIRVA